MADLDRGKRAGDERTVRSGPVFNPTEPAGHPTEQFLAHRAPPARLYAVARGHRLIFRGPHN